MVKTIVPIGCSNSETLRARVDLRQGCSKLVKSTGDGCGDGVFFFFFKWGGGGGDFFFFYGKKHLNF